jgi:hypothetical protein
MADHGGSRIRITSDMGADTIFCYLWALEQKKNQPKRLRIEWDMLKTLFWLYLSHFSTVWGHLFFVFMQNWRINPWILYPYPWRIWIWIETKWSMDDPCSCLHVGSGETCDCWCLTSHCWRSCSAHNGHRDKTLPHSCQTCWLHWIRDAMARRIDNDRIVWLNVGVID